MNSGMLFTSLVSYKTTSDGWGEQGPETENHKCPETALKKGTESCQFGVGCVERSLFSDVELSNKTSSINLSR
jgi:hypothetical protein